MNNTRTDWHDAARIAIKTGIHINTVRYHWRRAWLDLDLPPEASGFLDPDRAGKLIAYLQSKRRERRRARRVY